MNEQMLDQKVVNKLNELISDLMPRMPPYRYWQVKLKALEAHVRRSQGFRKRLHKKDNRLFGFTVETCMENRKPRYYAFIYRIKQLPGNRESLKLVRKRAFARKKKAKEKAYHWYCEHVKELNSRGIETLR